jgi:hypothetical protein
MNTSVSTGKVSLLASHRRSFYISIVSKNVSKSVGKVLDRVLTMLGLTQAQNRAFLASKTHLRRPIPSLASANENHRRSITELRR